MHVEFDSALLALAIGTAIIIPLRAWIGNRRYRHKVGQRVEVPRDGLLVPAVITERYCVPCPDANDPLTAYKVVLETPDADRPIQVFETDIRTPLQNNQ